MATTWFQSTSLFLLGTLSLGLLGPALPLSQAQNTCIFTDVCDTKDSAYASIKTLKDRGILQGNPDGSFRPEAIVNRAEILTMLFRTMPQEVRYDSGADFPDVASSSWYAPYVSTAKRRGFVQGYPDGTFRPGDGVKTEEAAKMVLAFQGTPLPDYSKGYTGDSNENGLPYGVGTREWYTPYIKTVHDYKLLEYVSLAEGLSRRDVAMLVAKAQSSTAEIEAPEKFLTAWNTPGGTLLQDSYIDDDGTRKGNGNVTAYLYFSKPLHITEAQRQITVTGNNGRRLPFEVKAHAWAFDVEKLDLKGYSYRPHELKLEIRGVADKEQIQITLPKGLPDIYGTSLQEKLEVRYGTATSLVYIQLGGPAYLQAGSDLSASVRVQSDEDPQLSGVTGYLCALTPQTIIQHGKRTSITTSDTENIAELEYLPLNRQLSPEEALKPFCQDIKTQNLTNVSKNNQAGTFDLAGFGLQLTPGAYFLGTYAFGSMGHVRGFAHKIIYVSDTALTLKYTQSSPMQGFVWATSLPGNDVRSGLPVTLYAIAEGDEGENAWKQVAQGTTDKDGILRFTLPEALPWGEELLAVASGAGHFGMVGSSWDRGIETYNYGLSMSWAGQMGEIKNHRMYVQTDRKIYRPGHNVGIRGVIRSKNKEGYGLPEQIPFTVAVYDAQNTLLTSFPATTTDQGTFSGELHLPETAPLGEYSIVLTDASPTQEYSWEQPIQATFEVEEYRRPEFRVSLKDTKKDYIAGESLQVEGNAEYYFGLPVQNGSYTWELTRESLYFQAPGLDWFSFTDSSYCYYYCDSANGYISSGNGILGTDGAFRISSALDLGDTSTGGLYTLSVEALDQNNRVVRAEKNIRVHKALAYVGVRTNNYLVDTNTSLSFDVASVNAEGASMGNKQVTLELYREDWTNYAKADVSGDMMSYNDLQQNAVARIQVTTDAQGRAKATFPPQKTAGSYFVKATILDDQGRTNSAREYSYVYDNAQDGYVTWAQGDQYKVEVLLDKPEYKPGENARLVIQSPFKEATALISMERGSVLDTMRVDLTSNNAPITLPVKASYIPNVYISVVLIPKGEQPGLRLGYGTMMVDSAEKELDIQVSTDKSVYKPGDQVRISLQTKDTTGKGVSADVSLAVVDESIIALAGGIDRDIMRAFYAMESLSIWTAHSLTHYVEQGLIRAVGGSGKGGPSGMPFLRGLLKDTAYWNPSVVTDASGKAEITFTLPDNLTRWELLAIGVTKDTKVGSASAEIDTRQDLIIQPILPRFVREGDQVTLTYTLFNLSTVQQDVRMTLSSPHTALTKNIIAESVPAGGSKTVSWQTTIPRNTPFIELQAQATGSTASDALLTRLPVQARDTFDYTGVSGYTSTMDTQLEIQVPANTPLVRDRSTVRVQVSAGLLGTLTPSLRYLVQYPYGCSEQTTSAMVGNLLLLQFMQTSSLQLDGVDKGAINTNVTAALSRLYRYQSEEGGFALWGGNEHIDPYLSSYVLQGMQQAMEEGIAVDTNVVRKLRAYLQRQLSQGSVSDLSTRASIAAILREMGTTGLDGTVDTLYRSRSDLTWRGKAALVRFYVAEGSTLGKERTKTLLDEMRSALKVDGAKRYIQEDKVGNYMFYYDTLAANAAVLEAFAIGAPGDKVIPGLTNYLLSQRQGGMWASTHENALILRGLNKTLTTTDTAPTEVEVQVGGTKTTLQFPQGALSTGQTIDVPLSQLSGDVVPVRIIGQRTPLFYDATLSYVRQENGQQISTMGYQLYRTLLEGDGTDRPLNRPIKVGESIKIRLSLKSNRSGESGKHIAIEDMLPAGLELLNPNIRTEGGTFDMSEGWLNHYELRDDRGFFYLDSTRDVTFTVDARAIAPGTFTYPAAVASEMYRPTKYTRTAPTTLTIQR